MEVPSLEWLVSLVAELMIDLLKLLLEHFRAEWSTGAPRDRWSDPAWIQNMLPVPQSPGECLSFPQAAGMRLLSKSPVNHRESNNCSPPPGCASVL